MDNAETLNAAQAASLLFADTETVLALAREGSMPGTKIGKSWVFLRQDVLDYLRARISEDTLQRRRQLQAASTPLATMMHVPSTSCRRPPPELPLLRLPAAPPQSATTSVAPDRSRASSRSV